jgi:hypothetical protein
VSFPAGPHTGDGGGPARRGLPRWGWRLLQPEWHLELLIVALIVMTMAAGWLLARR